MKSILKYLRPVKVSIFVDDFLWIVAGTIILLGNIAIEFLRWTNKG